MQIWITTFTKNIQKTLDKNFNNEAGGPEKQVFYSCSNCKSNKLSTLDILIKLYNEYCVTSVPVLCFQGNQGQVGDSGSRGEQGPPVSQLQ